MAKKVVEKAKTKEKQVGVVSNYFEQVGVVAIELKAPLKIGDKIRIVGGDVDFEQKIESMQIDRKPVKEAKKGDDVGIKVKERVRKGYKVFKV